MKILTIILSLLVTTTLFAGAAEIYKEALEQEEIKGDFVKAKSLYKKIVSGYVSEQGYVARSLYHIAIISEMYGEKNNAKSYYNMILTNYSNISGLKYLASNGISRLDHNKIIQKVANTNNTNNSYNKKAITNISTPTVKKKTYVVDSSPFANNKYRVGKTSPMYIINLGEKVTISFENGIQGLAASDPTILKLNPTTSKIEFSGQKIGKCEMVITDKTGKKNKCIIIVVDPNNLTIDAQYLIKGESRIINIQNLKQVALDNDNLKVEPKDGKLSIKSTREGKVTLTLQKKDGTNINVKFLIYKPYDANKTMSMNLLQTKNIEFKNRSSVTITNNIIDVKSDGDNIKVTATKSGETILIIYGKDGSQLKYHITVK